MTTQTTDSNLRRAESSESRRAIADALSAHCAGQLYYHPLFAPPRAPKYSDNLRDLCDAAGAMWFLDHMLSRTELVIRRASSIDRRGVDFHAWRIEPHGNGARITCRADTGAVELDDEVIRFTDFPFGEMPQDDNGTPHLTVWNEGGVLILPNEH